MRLRIQTNRTIFARAWKNLCSAKSKRYSSHNSVKAFYLTLAILIQSVAPLQASRGGASGRLLASDGTPATNVRIGLSPVGDSNPAVLLGIVRTDGMGGYRIDQAPAGRYYLVAGLVDAPTYFPGVMSRAAATVLEVSDGAVQPIPDFRLVPTSTGLRIRGRVVSETVPINRLTSSITVRLTGGPLAMSLSTGVGNDGLFEFTELRAGQYLATVGPNVIMFPVPVVLRDKDVVDFELSVRVVTDEMIATAVSQLRARPILIGDVAKQLSERDIAAIALGLPAGSKPWLLIGSRAVTTEEQIEAYTSPNAPLNNVRQGSMILLRRSPPDTVWTLADASTAYSFPGANRTTLPPSQTASYAQVAVTGRDFDDVTGEQDDNRPFVVSGSFDNTVLSSLATFVRGTGQPIVLVAFMPDDSVRVLLRRQAMSYNWLTLRRQEQTWIVVEQGGLNITRR